MVSILACRDNEIARNDKTAGKPSRGAFFRNWTALRLTNVAAREPTKLRPERPSAVRVLHHPSPLRFGFFAYHTLAEMDFMRSAIRLMATNQRFEKDSLFLPYISKKPFSSN